MLGTSVCPSHGGLAPQVRAAALRNVDLAEEIARNPRRPASEIRAAALHGADVVMRRCEQRYDTERTPEATVDYINAVERCDRLARGMQDADDDEQYRRVMVRVVDQMWKVYTAILSDLGHDPQDRDVQASFQRHVSPVRDAAQRKATETATRKDQT